MKLTIDEITKLNAALELLKQVYVSTRDDEVEEQLFEATIMIINIKNSGQTMLDQG